MATPAAAQDYHFNDKGQWVDQQGNRFRFVDQQHYDRMCAKMTEDLYGLLQSQCSLRKVNLRGEHHVDKEESFVFISQNFETAHFLVVLINGSGAVRAGQWSRRLIVNESLDVGSQLPYIRQCIARGWAVLVANTNDNTYLDDEHDEAQTKQGSSDAIEHGQTVWRQLVVAKSAARRIALIAHSYGGHVVSEMLEAEKNPNQLGRIRAICLTDALYDSRTFDRLKEQNANVTIRNWTCSDTPLDTRLDNDESVSAGTQEHECSSAMAMESILRLIATKFNE